MGNDNSIGTIRTKKALIRKDILKKRREMSPEEVKRLSADICDRFLASDEYRNADVILLYKAYNNEVDTDIIFEKALSDGKKVAFPLSRIVDGEPDLSFYFVNDLSELTEGFMGILEPDTALSPQPFEGRADVCITPGVAFDGRCHRIGYGKAFYDRYIRLHRPGSIIALAYELQITSNFESEKTDIAVDAVITENAVIRP